jgi:hypothetical protein
VPEVEAKVGSRLQGEFNVKLSITESAFRKTVVLIIAVASLLSVSVNSVSAQEQSRESMAVDATATQWSYQLAVEGFFDYKTDTLDNGMIRPEGNKGFLQFRWVAPIPKSEKVPITLLPRLTLRLVENKDGDNGFGSSDIFVLGIMNQWAKGRWGIGPQINFPAKGGFGNTNWGIGFAAAITQRELNDKLFLALLLQQTWRKVNDPSSDAVLGSPLSINPIFVFQLGQGWYLGNGDFVINYNWYENAWFVPFGVRLGKAFIGEKSTWNAYVEYSTSLIYKDWPGPAADHAFRVNVQYQVPVTF